MSLPPEPANQAHDDQNSNGLLLERRRILSGLGMVGLGCLTSIPSTASAQEVVVRVGSGKAGKAAKVGRLHLPEEWMRRNRYADVYYRYMHSLNLKSIDPAQVIASHAKERNGVWNGLPPRDTWRRMGYVLKVVDRIAREMNVREVEVVSAYRSPAYNSRCYGAKKGSWHQANVAVDVSFDKTRPHQVTSVARELRRLGLFRGGVGGYRNFTHIDARGYNADW